MVDFLKNITKIEPVYPNKLKFALQLHYSDMYRISQSGHCVVSSLINSHQTIRTIFDAYTEISDIIVSFPINREEVVKIASKFSISPQSLILFSPKGIFPIFLNQTISDVVKLINYYCLIDYKDELIQFTKNLILRDDFFYPPKFIAFKNFYPSMNFELIPSNNQNNPNNQMNSENLDAIPNELINELIELKTYAKKMQSEYPVIKYHLQKLQKSIIDDRISPALRDKLSQKIYILKGINEIKKISLSDRKEQLDETTQS